MRVEFLLMLYMVNAVFSVLENGDTAEEGAESKFDL